MMGELNNEMREQAKPVIIHTLRKKSIHEKYENYGENSTLRNFKSY